MMSSFSSSSFDPLITTTATDDVEAPVKDGSEEESADGTPGADRLFDALATAENGSGSFSSSSLPSSSIFINATQYY